MNLVDILRWNEFFLKYTILNKEQFIFYAQIC